MANEPKTSSWLARLGAGLSRSSHQLGEGIGAVFTKHRLDEETLAKLEELLIAADLGITTGDRVNTKSIASGQQSPEPRAKRVAEEVLDAVAKRNAQGPQRREAEEDTPAHVDRCREFIG